MKVVANIAKGYESEATKDSTVSPTRNYESKSKLLMSLVLTFGLGEIGEKGKSEGVAHRVDDDVGDEEC